MHSIFTRKRNRIFDIVVLLQPTSPLRTVFDINAAIELMVKKNAEAIVSVCEAEHHPLWANTLPEDGSMKNFIREDIKGKNRQEIAPYFRLNGAVYISTIAALEKYKSFIHNETYAYQMPTERSVDIDNKIDFLLADFLIRNS